MNLDSVKLLHRNTVYQAYYRLDQITLQHQLFNQGWSEIFTHEVVVRKDVVAILLYDPQCSQFVLIEQFRTGVYCRHIDDPTCRGQSPWTLEIVAGDVEAQESLTQVAQRETKEETGLMVTALVPIMEYWLSPANQSSKVTIFLGRVDSRNAKGIHGLSIENEDIRVHVIPVETAYTYLADRKISYAPAIIALQWFKLHESQIPTLWNT